MVAVASVHDEAAAALRAVCSVGLSGSAPYSGPVLGPVSWANLVSRVKTERLEGLLAATVARAALAVTAEQDDAVREIARSRVRLDLILERECLRTAEVLNAASIPFRVLKGPAVAHLVYPDPSMRGFGDVDLLVEAASWYRAVDALRDAGFKRLVPEIREGFDVSYGKDATLASPRGCQIDLHRNLVLGPYGFWVDTDELFARPAGVLTLGGTAVPVLGPEESFVYACYNAALADDPPRLAALRDVAEMALRGDLDPVVVNTLVRRWRGTAVVHRALEVASRYLEVDLRGSNVGEVFIRGSIPAVDRILLASYRGPGRGYTSQLAGVVAIRGVASKMRYLWSLARPQSSYLQSRGYTPASFVRHAARRIWGAS